MASPAPGAAAGQPMQLPVLSDPELNLAGQMRALRSRRADISAMARVPDVRKRNFEVAIQELDTTYSYKVKDHFIIGGSGGIEVVYLVAINFLCRTALIEVDDKEVLVGLTSMDINAMERQDVRISSFSNKRGQLDAVSDMTRGIALVGENTLSVAYKLENGNYRERTFVFGSSSRVDEKLADTMMSVPIFSLGEIRKSSPAVRTMLLTSTNILRKEMRTEALRGFNEMDAAIRRVFDALKRIQSSFDANLQKLEEGLVKLETKDGKYAVQPPQTTEEQKQFEYVRQCLLTYNQVLDDQIQAGLMAAHETPKILTTLIALEGVANAMDQSMSDVGGPGKKPVQKGTNAPQEVISTPRQGASNQTYVARKT